ncbi:MAG: sulfatase-like hydrolase/transferase [Planctomycetota bacterium]|jgi:arylsulfatase A-like enzyme
MNRRAFLKAVGAAVTYFSLPVCISKSIANSEKPPNLLFIMTDQQRFDALSYVGNKILNTPNMDRLAQEGAWFENAYTQCAVCTPARASMLTGHTVANTKVISNKQAYVPEYTGVMPMKTYDEILSEPGYECEYYGKWHTPTFRARIYNNPVTAAGIHKTELGPGKKAAYLKYLDPLYPDRELKEGELKDTLTERPYVPDPIDQRFDLKNKGLESDIKVGQSDIHGVTTIPAEYHISAFEAGKTIQALEKLKDKTFSLTCSFHHPHPPYLAAEKYLKMYPPERMVPPVSINDDMADSPYLSMKERTNENYSDQEMIQYFISEYYALVKEVDDWIGQILNKLDDLGLTDNTMVVFTSDHGEMMGSHGMRGKFCFYEESSHVPMMIRFPGRIKPATKVKAPVSNTDLFATILDYLDMPPHPSDGSSLRGLIEGTANEDTYVVTEWLSDLQGKPSHMVVKGGWKLILPDPSAKKLKKALYNLNDDPHELKNLLANNADSKNDVAKVAELEAYFQDWMGRTSQNKL